MANAIKKYGYLFLFISIIPLFNVVTSLATPFFPGSLNPGIFRGIILSLFLLWYMIILYKHNFITQPTIIFITYLFILCWFSNLPLTSLYIYNKVIITCLMFIVGLQSFNSTEKFKFLLRIIVLSLIFQELYFLYSNVAGIGRMSYRDDSVFFGETGVNMTKAMVIFLIALPAFLRIEKNKNWKLIAFIVFLIGTIIVIFGMKRSAILALMSGFIIYLIFTPYKSRIIKFLPILLIIAFITSPLYLSIIEKRYKKRQERVSMSYDQLKENESEGRVLEIKYTIEDAFEEGAARLFFGYNLFLVKDFNGHGRMLHVDYMNMLGGAGIIGLGLFLYVYYRIGWLLWRIKQKMKNNLFIAELSATGLALIAVQAFLSIGGTMQGVNLRGYILFLLGAILSVMIFMYNKQAETSDEIA
jgi:hypothetical protein